MRVFSAALLLLVFLAGCDFLNKPDEDSSSSVARGFAREFQNTMELPATSRVTFVGPVETGTVIRDLQPGGKSTVRMVVPDTAGTTYVFFIDDEPAMKLAHDFRYVWMDFDKKVYQVAAAVWNGMIERPGITSAPFSPQESFRIDSVEFFYMTGEGTPEIQDDSGVIPYESPLADPLQGRGATTGLHKRAPVKWAFVMDCGGQGGKPDAKNMHDIDAEPIFAWVVDNNFATKRISQWAQSEDETFTNTPGGEHIRNKFLFAIEDFGDLFSSLGEPDNGCDEFFMYIGAHSTSLGNVAIYYPDGSDAALVGYGEILYRIQQHFPTWVKVTLFYDLCFSGGAIADNRPRIAELCDQLCSFTCITACDSIQKTPLPNPDSSTDSATEDFLEGATEDHDGDGNVGDIQDRFLEMKQEWGNRGPMSIHCPEDISWCSLDGPDNQTACADIQSEYQVAVNDVEDAGEHREFIGEPFANPITISVNSPLQVIGTVPFVEVTGEVDGDCSFTATGSGVVAGYPDVSVTMSGAYTAGTVTFTYTMGAGGELPGGEAITFFCTGTRR